VKREEGVALASQWDCPFFETSAALRHFVDDVFHSIVREIRRRDNQLSSSAAEPATAGSQRSKHKAAAGRSPNGTGRDFGKLFRKIFH